MIYSRYIAAALLYLSSSIQDSSTYIDVCLDTRILSMTLITSQYFILPLLYSLLKNFRHHRMAVTKIYILSGSCLV